MEAARKFDVAGMTTILVHSNLCEKSHSARRDDLDSQESTCKFSVLLDE